MADTGSVYQIPFFSTNGSISIDDFTIDIFTLEGVDVDSTVLDSLSIASLGVSDYWALQFTPTQSGTYIIAAHDTADNIRIVQNISIDEADVFVNLTQNTGGANNLKPNGNNLDQFLLMVFVSSDWEVGRTDNSYAAAITQMDPTGNWITTPLVITPGTYHIVIRNNFGVTTVIAAYLEV